MRQVMSAVAAFNYFNMHLWILKNQKKKKKTTLALYGSWIKIEGKKPFKLYFSIREQKKGDYYFKRQ